jgi:arylsulfatase A-like enzyme
VPAGRTSDTVWAHWDLLPTLAGLAGAAVPAGVDGSSMQWVLDGRVSPEATARTLYWEFHEGGYKRAARRGQWKAVWLSPDRPIELYDLATDQGETRDVAANHADVVEQFRSFFATARTPSERWPGR